MAPRHQFAQRRRAVGLTQETLAERLSVDRSTIARWEAGETEPLPWLRPKLARTLQISIDQLDGLLVLAADPEAVSDERLSYAMTHPGSVDLVAVARIRERVYQLDGMYDKAPSASLLAEAGQCLGQVSFLRAGAAPGRVRRELSAVESEAATLMGQLVWDASQRRDHSTAGPTSTRPSTPPAMYASRPPRPLRCCVRALWRSTVRKPREPV